MPLIKSILNDNLRTIFDKEYSGFNDFPESLQDAATKWAAAHDEYASQVIPSSTTAQAATKAFEAQILLMEGNTLGITHLKNAFLQYAILLGTGMAPTFTATPPAGPPPIDYIPALGFAGASSEDIATELSNTIDLWMKTGTATNTSSGAVTNWN